MEARYFFVMSSRIYFFFITFEIISWCVVKCRDMSDETQLFVPLASYCQPVGYVIYYLMMVSMLESYWRDSYRVVTIRGAEKNNTRIRSQMNISAILSGLGRVSPCAQPATMSRNNDIKTLSRSCLKIVFVRCISFLPYIAV